MSVCVGVDGEALFFRGVQDVPYFMFRAQPVVLYPVVWLFRTKSLVVSYPRAGRFVFVYIFSTWAWFCRFEPKLLSFLSNHIHFLYQFGRFEPKILKLIFMERFGFQYPNTLFFSYSCFVLYAWSFWFNNILLKNMS